MPADTLHRTAERDEQDLDLLRRLLDVPAPSGSEARMADFLQRSLGQLGFEPERDAAGNVLVRIPGRDPSMPLGCFAAHMDEIGMTVTGVDAGGRVRVDRLGGLLRWKLGETPVVILGDVDDVPGVVSMGSGHAPGAAAAVPEWSEIAVLTGLSAADLRGSGVHAGSPIVPAREQRGPFLYGGIGDDQMVAAWSLDNRLGVLCQLRTLEIMVEERVEPAGPLLFAFTVQEEIGCHGAAALALRERPDIMIAVDGCPLTPGSGLVMNGRPGIRTRDHGAIYDPALVRSFCATADRIGIPLQPVVYQVAGSDAGHAHAVGAAPRAACLGYVRENSHGYETAPLSAFRALTEVLAEIVRSWPPR